MDDLWYNSSASTMSNPMVSSKLMRSLCCRLLTALKSWGGWETSEWNLECPRKSRGFHICNCSSECLRMRICWFFHRGLPYRRWLHRCVCDCSGGRGLLSVFWESGKGICWRDCSYSNKRSNPANIQRTSLTTTDHLTARTYSGTCATDTHSS